MDAQRIALIAAMAQDMENMIGRLTELARMSKEMQPLAYPWWETMESQEQEQSQETAFPSLTVAEVSCCDSPGGCVHRCCRCQKDLTLEDHEGICLGCVKGKAKRRPYNNRHWPSPRPKLFASAFASAPAIKTHADALEFLAQRADISVEALLQMDPTTYAQKHMQSKPPLYWRQQHPYSFSS